jgi:succinate dehydrogenase / fumarate reductase, iron-sulfur subunit
MTDPNLIPDAAGRRRFFVRIIQGVHGVMGATLALVLGRAVMAPAFERREPLWLAAADADALADNVPVPVTVRVARPDGASEAVDRRVVYLVKTGTSPVRAFDSTCTHLGCRTRFNPETMQIECPCHGGVYDTAGQVVSGPPPAPLAELPTRVEGGRVLVQV